MCKVRRSTVQTVSRNLILRCDGARGSWKFHGPIMVQQFFLSALKLLLGATRVA